MENCHTVSALETLEKFARALEVSLGALFYESDARSRVSQSAEKPPPAWGKTRQEAGYYSKMVGLLSKMTPERRNLLLDMAAKMGGRHEQGQKRSAKV